MWLEILRILQMFDYFHHYISIRVKRKKKIYSKDKEMNFVHFENEFNIIEFSIIIWFN